MHLSVTAEDPLGEAAQKLISELTEEIRTIYSDLGQDGAGAFNPHTVLVPRSAFVVARLGGEPVGCGAIKPLDPDVAEVKRMYVAPQARRKGVGTGVLAELERLAAGFGYRALRLETGRRQPAAIALYQACGFQPIPPYGRYIGDPISLCYEKRIF